ncbi:MAG: hypothetical protein ABR556_08820 [Pyrinomonadaceae bacterium]
MSLNKSLADILYSSLQADSKPKVQYESAKLQASRVKHERLAVTIQVYP